MDEGRSIWLWQWAGADPAILLMSDASSRSRYAVLGLLLVGVFALCFGSALYAFQLMFGSDLIAALFAVFWALVIHNLYRFLLTTVNPHILPHTKRSGKSFFTWLAQYGFLAFLAAIISKPLELYLLSHFESLGAETGQLSTMLVQLHEQLPATWLITFFVVMFFLWPFMLKKSFARSCDYETRRANLERMLIEAHHNKFLKRYNDRMAPYGVSWSSAYVDAPFNTELIPDPRKIQPRGSLVKWARTRLKNNGK